MHGFCLFEQKRIEQMRNSEAQYAGKGKTTVTERFLWKVKIRRNLDNILKNLKWSEEINIFIIKKGHILVLDFLEIKELISCQENILKELWKMFYYAAVGFLFVTVK